VEEEHIVRLRNYSAAEDTPGRFPGYTSPADYIHIPPVVAAYTRLGVGTEDTPATHRPVVPVLDNPLDYNTPAQPVSGAAEAAAADVSVSKPSDDSHNTTPTAEWNYQSH